MRLPFTVFLSARADQQADQQADLAAVSAADFEACLPLAYADVIDAGLGPLLDRSEALLGIAQSAPFTVAPSAGLSRILAQQIPVQDIIAENPAGDSGDSQVKASMLTYASYLGDVLKTVLVTYFLPRLLLVLTVGLGLAAVVAICWDRQHLRLPALLCSASTFCLSLLLLSSYYAVQKWHARRPFLTSFLKHGDLMRQSMRLWHQVQRAQLHCIETHQTILDLLLPYDGAAFGYQPLPESLRLALDSAALALLKAMAGLEVSLAHARQAQGQLQFHEPFTRSQHARIKSKAPS